MDPGIATPEASTTMWSGAGSSFDKLTNASTRLSPNEQQMQPPASEIISSLSASIKSSSMGNSPNSLTKIAKRWPLALRSMLLMSVVLPAPR